MGVTRLVPALQVIRATWVIYTDRRVPRQLHAAHILQAHLSMHIAAASLVAAQAVRHLQVHVLRKVPARV